MLLDLSPHQASSVTLSTPSNLISSRRTWFYERALVTSKKASEGRFCGMVCSCIDFSSRKAWEELVKDLTCTKAQRILSLLKMIVHFEPHLDV